MGFLRLGYASEMAARAAYQELILLRQQEVPGLVREIADDYGLAMVAAYTIASVRLLDQRRWSAEVPRPPA